jgi:HK97 family phage major capsid protein/HK97 family phage prohead protease
MQRLDLEVKLSPGEAGTFAGYASRFGGEPDSVGDVIAPGAFGQSLAEHKAAGTWPLMLWQHDTTEPIGVWEAITEDREGLAVKGRLILETRRGAEAYALLKAGALNGLSIGYRARDFERLPAAGRLLKAIDLQEISLVSVPAASRARVTDVKAERSANPETAAAVASKGGSPMAVDVKAADVAATDDAGVSARVAGLENSVEAFGARLRTVEDAVGNVAKSAATIEQKLSRPGFVAETKETAGEFERKAFATYLRAGREAMAADEVKSMTVSPDTAGGYLAPPQFVAEVVKGIIEFSPVRQAARVGQTAAGEVLLPKRTGRPTANWSGETEARTGTDPTYGQVEIAIHEATAFVDVSQRLLEDAAVNVEAEVAFDLAEEFGRLEGVALVKGDGVKKPTGFLASADVPTVATGAAATLGANPADTLIGFLYRLPAFYRNNGVWMMNATTLTEVRRLKDTTGQYLWQPAFQAGQPETILGRPVIEAPDMDNIGANLFPIAFGDFGRGYRVYDRLALSVMRDPYSQAANGLVRYHARRRVGGAVVLGEAIRKLRCAVS